MATKVGDAYVEISTRDNKLVAGLDKAQKNVGASMKNIGRSMTIAGAAIVAGFGMAIKTAAQFEQSMANTASVAGATAEELKNLSDYAREMGEQSVFSASEAADAMYFLASAGMNTTEIMGALEGTLALAAATGSDLAFVSESVAAALSQFGLDASEATRIANVYAAAISGSQATMDKLSTSMSYVGPMAKSMGMTIEDTTGILMGLYDAGIDGSMAGTALRMAFVKLLAPTEEGTAALDDLGVSIVDSEGKMRPFVDIMEDLEKAGISTTDAIDIFGVRAGPAMMALVSQGTDAIRENTDAITGTEKASEMAEMQIDTFQGAIKLLRSAFEELQITLVRDLMPALKGMIEKVTEGIKKVSEWMKENPKLTETIVKITAGVGALMLVLGPLLMILPGLVTAFAGIKAAIGAIGLISSGPIGWLILAVGAVYLAFKNWDKIVEIVGKIKDAVIAKITEWSASLNKWWDNIIENTDNKWLLIADKIIKAIGNTYKWLVENIGKWISSIAKWWSNIESDTESIWFKIKDIIIKYVQFWVDFITDILPKLILDIIGWWEDIKSNTETLWEAIKFAIMDIVKEIWDGITSILEPIVEFVSSLWNSIKGDSSTIWGGIESIINVAVGGIESVIDGMISAIENAWATAQKIYNWIKGKLDAASTMIENAPTITTGGESVSDIIESVEETKPWPVYGSHQHGTPYIPKTGLYQLHKGEAVIPASQNTYNQQKSYASSINIQPGAINIVTPKWSNADGQELFRQLERQIKMRGLKLVTV